MELVNIKLLFIKNIYVKFNIINLLQSSGNGQKSDEGILDYPISGEILYK